MYYAYVLENFEKRHYTGSTADLNERLLMHNDVTSEKAGFHRTTYKKGPWRVLFVKAFSSRGEAVRFEKFLKTAAGRKWLKEQLRIK